MSVFELDVQPKPLERADRDVDRVLKLDLQWADLDRDGLRAERLAEEIAVVINQDRVSAG